MAIKSFIKAKFSWLFAAEFRELNEAARTNILLLAGQASLVNRNSGPIRGLEDVEFCAFSQWGEDGIIQWLVDRIPGIPKTFIEFGVVDFREANCRLLVELRNWRGLVMDSSGENISSIRNQNIYWRHEITALEAFVETSNINQLISGAGYDGEVGILSVDIDGNDYWVWESISAVSPSIVICEYNAVFGDLHELTIPYQPDFQRSQAHHSNLLFGASIRALIGLGQRKGFTFVGTNSNGCNAFFVRNDLAESVVNSLEAVWLYPSLFREARAEEGPLQFVGGPSRSAIVEHLPLVNLQTGQLTDLRSCGELYSPEWRRGARVKL